MLGDSRARVEFAASSLLSRPARPASSMIETKSSAAHDRGRLLMRFAIETLGCKVNQYDSAIIEDRLRRAGLEPAGVRANC